MATTLRRVSAVLSLVLSLTLVTTALGSVMSTAAAAPSKIGSVLNLTVSAGAAPSGGYRVTATWDPLARATAYVVKLTLDGRTISSSRISDTSWGDTVAAPAGTLATVTVTALDGRRRGKPASASTTLPDVTGPNGTYELAISDMTATVTETALSDDVTPRDQVARSIDWGDEGGFETYPTGAVVEHTYAELGRYVPRVRLRDAAGNTTTLTLRAVVLGDTVAPTGAYTASPQAAWTGFTPVRLTEVSLEDDYTPNDLIARSIDWGDGVTEAWTGTRPSHVYEVPGNYPVRVVLTDEVGNARVVEASMPVIVKDDAVAPTVKLRLPKRELRRVASWRVLRGTAADAETGVAKVQVKVVQYRSGDWVAFRSGRWVRAASKKAAWAKATPRSRQVSDTGAWRVRVPRLRRGGLVSRSWATDVAGNVGKPVVRRQRLTRR
jgi:hypothetical protein